MSKLIEKDASRKLMTKKFPGNIVIISFINYFSDNDYYFVKKKKKNII